MTPTKDNKTTAESIYEYYEQLPLPELQKELKKIENMRRKYDFCTGLDGLRKAIEAKVTELKKCGCSQKEISKQIYDFIIFNAVFDKNNPMHALSLAMKEAQTATVFALNAEKEFDRYKEQLKKAYGINI